MASRLETYEMLVSVTRDLNAAFPLTYAETPQAFDVCNRVESPPAPIVAGKRHSPQPLTESEPTWRYS